VTFTARRLNRATLARQLLLERAPLAAVDAVRRVVAVQAQEPASPYVALWNRVDGFDAADLDTAYARHEVVKASLVRITLHAVAADDYPSFQHAVVHLLRAARLHDNRFKETGLTIEEADALVPDVVSYLSEPRTNADVERWLEARLGAPAPRVWWALRTYAPVVHAPVGSVWAHGPRPAYVAARTVPPTGDPEPSVRRLVRRYLEGFGPASAKDIAQFTLLRAPSVKAALDALGDSLERFEGPGGVVLHDVPDGLRPDEDTPAPPRLLGMWDSVLLAYADRDRVIDAEHRPLVIRRNGDVLPTVLVDGRVAGVWRPVDGGIEVTRLGSIPDDAWSGLAAEAAALVAFLADRDPNVYRRASHWWTSIPAAEVRVLPAAPRSSPGR
jgi:hypothetical protein